VDLGTDHLPVQLSAGYMITCALLDDGSVKCWGENLYGQFGEEDADNRLVPTAVNLTHPVALTLNL